MRKTDMNPNAKLSFVERLGYGIGDYAGNLVCSAISAFLLVYYTNVVGANAAVAASVIAVSKLLDGVSDLAMGYIVDHTHSRFGKARPWILRLCVPLAVSTVLMFSVPAGVTERVQIVYMFLTYNLTSTVFYTGVNVPYATMHGLMTTNQYERGLWGNFRMLLATAGTMTINTVVLKLTGFFGGGDIYSQKGWTLTFVVLMVIFVLLNLFVFAVCKERVVEKEDAKESKQKVSFLQGFVGLVKNRYWMLMVLCLFIIYFMMSCFFGSAFYFAQYNMGDERHYAMIANVLSIAQIATMFVTPFLMKKMSKKNVLLIGVLTTLAGFVLTGFTMNFAAICALSAISISFVWLPAIAVLIATIGVFFYDLDKKYDKVVADLEAGKHKADE